MSAPSLETLVRDAGQLGVRVEMLEKAWRILDLAADICVHPGAAGRLALQGGTALNLFVTETIPRLSVDADFNFVGAVDRDTTATLRP